MKIKKLKNLVTAWDYMVIVHNVCTNEYKYIHVDYSYHPDTHEEMEEQNKKYFDAMLQIDLLNGRKHDVTSIDVNSATHRLEIRVNDYEGVADKA